MRYAEKLKAMKAGGEEVEWSSTADFPALIWFRNRQEGDRLGWWLYWTDAGGDPQHMLISQDEHDEAGAKVRAREVLAVARPGS